MFAMQKIIPGFTVSNPVDRKKGNVTDMAKKNTYDAGSISVLEGLEAVRKRPGMYIGSVSRKGLNHLIYEIVDNAVDEHLAGYCSLIHVILEKDGSCTVTDNGRGIPVDMHEQSIVDEIVSKLDTEECRVIKISLIVDEANLRKRLLSDIANKIRTGEIMDKSIARIQMYQVLDTVKIDTSNKSVCEITEEIAAL